MPGYRSLDDRLPIDEEEEEYVTESVERKSSSDDNRIVLVRILKRH